MNPETTIKSCILPKRVKTCLAKAGIETIGQLCNKTAHQINMIPKLGVNSLSTLMAFVRHNGLTLRPDSEQGESWEHDERYLNARLEMPPAYSVSPKQEKWALIILNNNYFERIAFNDKMLCDEAFEQFNKLRPNGVNFIFQKLRLE